MRISVFPLELMCWVAALILLAISNPQEHNFTFCPFANMGITWCPGCGLGRSISGLLHGDLYSSLRFHWFGIPALAILLHRMLSLIKNAYLHAI